MSNYALPLSGKVAIVTGGTRGIGEGIALELANRGATVIITYVSQNSDARAKKICETIESLPHKPRAHAVRADLSTLDGPQAIINNLLEWSGNNLKIDILVNNAGVENVKRLEALTIDDYNLIFDLNVRGTVFLTKAVLPYLNAYGRIINIGSIGSRGGYANFCLYGASKAALEGLTRSWATELGHNGTTVNSVNPGPVESDMLANVPQDFVQFQKEHTPVEKRLGTTAEIGNIVAALCGKDGSWITGQTISASGGYDFY
ncbi:NAD(P)-binding protein [Hypomontagnella submonticulosa]|nr:NAD(P)-binding protein [Hypomontagnella submonticulosa]